MQIQTRDILTQNIACPIQTTRRVSLMGSVMLLSNTRREEIPTVADLN